MAFKTIQNSKVIANFEEFQEHSSSITSRRFISLNTDKIKQLYDSEFKKQFIEKYGLELDCENESLIISTKEQTDIITKYLCDKVVRDAVTDELFEATFTKRLNIPSAAS